jgi:pyrimidine operon attenuation protein / uracil phosphoribosyltransferase
MNIKEKVEVLDEEKIGKALTRIAHEIIERHKTHSDLILVGIRSRGDDLAVRLRAEIKKAAGIELPLGVIDIAMYRDDLMHKKHWPTIQSTEIDAPLDGKVVILVDDVLYTGRTIRAAMDAIIDIGRPRAIQLAVLVDRGHREMPIKPDYVGRNVPTSRQEVILVELKEADGRDRVAIAEIIEEKD